MTADRLPCLVPFCRRTTARETFVEWICSDHWRGVPRRAKFVLARARRRRDELLFSTVWANIKRRAIEAAAGIAI